MSGVSKTLESQRKMILFSLKILTICCEWKALNWLIECHIRYTLHVYIYITRWYESYRNKRLKEIDTHSKQVTFAKLFCLPSEKGLL